MTTAGTEAAVAFDCAGERLAGIVHAGASGATLGMVVVVGGPQYRAGSHRQFVQLARRCSAAGFPVLRFDVRGMGDSSGAQRRFDSLDDDIAAAIGALHAQVPTLQRVVLWGLCDGASAALLYLHGRPDARVAGMALLNPWVRSEASLARTQVKHYYRQRLLEADFWAKLFKGGVGWRALSGLLASLRAMGSGASGSRGKSAAAATEGPFPQRMAQAWARFPGSLLLLVSESDLTAHEFLEVTATDADWQRAFAAKPARRVDLPGADHTCSEPAAAAAVEAATLEWLRLLGNSVPNPAHPGGMLPPSPRTPPPGAAEPTREVSA